MECSYDKATPSGDRYTLGGQRVMGWGNPKTERNAAICERLRSGRATISIIARELGLTIERVRQIALRKGITSATYAHFLPPSKQAVRAIEVARAHGAAIECKKHMVARILALRAQGLTQRQIGARVGLSQKWVSSLLIEAGHRSIHKPLRVLPKRKRRRKSRNTAVGAPAFVTFPNAKIIPHEATLVERARELWKAGLSAQVIAKRLTSKERDLSKNAVIGIAHRNGFPSRPSPIQR